jgi:AraC family transcriptional regulator, arabinose operon regulatory protein
MLWQRACVFWYQEMLPLQSTMRTGAFAQPAVSPLGTIRLAGFIENGRGAGGPRRYPSFALVILLDGLGFYRDERGYSVQLTPGDLTWVFPRLQHAYGPQPTKHWTEFFIVFDGPIFELWEAQNLFRDLAPVQHLDHTEIWLDRLLAVCSSQPRTSAGACAAIVSLQVALIDLIRMQAKPSDDLPEWLERGAHALEQLDLPVGGFAQMAKNLGVSYETFRKRFRTRFGLSPQQYRLRYLMERAAILLTEEQLSVKETAARVGFCDPYHFSRTFRKVTGRSPSAVATRRRGK